MQKKVQPFHKAIEEAIRRCSTTRDALLLLQLIQGTKILEGHDEIIAAINDFFDFPGAAKYSREVQGAKKAILSQKRTEEKKSISLNELQEEVEKLLALLNDRQPGLITWHEFMRERLQKLYELSSQALGK